MEDLFTRGIEEFNRQYFFEAHDLWEEVWRDCTGHSRLFYQGLIQTAVGFYHLSNNNFKGAESQLGKALTKLEHYPPFYHGINTQQLAAGVRLCLADIRRAHEGTGGFDESKIPRIRLAGSE